jgi:hypothetical protein
MYDNKLSKNIPSQSQIRSSAIDSFFQENRLRNQRRIDATKILQERLLELNKNFQSRSSQQVNEPNAEGNLSAFSIRH